MNVIKLGHVTNVRDLGGTKTKDGRTIKEKLLLRGRVLSKHAKADINTLIKNYNLKTVIDLRCDKELNEKPDVLPKNINYLYMPLSSETVVGISHEKRIHSFTSLYMLPELKDLYHNLVCNECRENLVNILKTILYLPEDQFSVYFHCTAGKDRTGVVSALLLAFLGVDQDLIVQDYMFTNKTSSFKANMAFLGLVIAKLDIKLAKKVRSSLLAEKSAIIESMNTLINDYGSLDKFFEKELQISEVEKEKLRNKFLI